MHSAKQIDEELKLQGPLYLLVLRDLVGVEPLGGVYRSLSGARVSRGLLRRDAADDLPGYNRNDYLPDEEFWALVESARERAAGFAGFRIEPATSITTPRETRVPGDGGRRSVHRRSSLGRPRCHPSSAGGGRSHRSGPRRYRLYRRRP